MKAPRQRCAIYTRKSSEEGLDQEFNSLDAQREAGEAYVRSQSGEGWALLPARYDDGGFSGGSMERPALRRLLDDIAAGLIDVIVVYKIDRLTRSLADFARMVELFDKHHVSFVSVTQSFNTTSSMGRLTLNVLLSFAQFEREVTGERIRDKIAASKARGMWMGGTLPLGYDLPTDKSRALVVNEQEAEVVRAIFPAYCRLRSVHALERELAEQGVVSKLRRLRDGKEVGGQPFSRGALFHLLRNRTYLGKIVHKDVIHEGAHDAIIEEKLFGDVQRLLDANARRTESQSASRRGSLTGRLFDERGNPMSPSFSRGRSGKTYRYYVSAPLQQGARLDGVAVRRLSAPAFETLLTNIVGSAMPANDGAMDRIRRVDVHHDSLQLVFDAADARHLRADAVGAELIKESDNVRLVVPARQSTRGSCTVLRTSSSRSRRDPVLIKALRRAHAMVGRDHQGMPIIDAAPESPYLRRLLRLAFLAPDLQRDILAGRQPPELTLERLMKVEITSCWTQQRVSLGWS